MNGPRLYLVSLISSLLAACVDTRPPPFIPAQAQVAYGPRVYLIDATQDAPPLHEVCTRFGQVAMIPTTTTATVVVMPTDGKMAGMAPVKIPANQPHNCYIKVQSKTLLVDEVEVTNDLFQLCVDSGVCDSPDPSKASKGDVCTSSDKFEECPVAQVSQQQANQFCQFIGRRLPSGVEHVIMRQGGFSGAGMDPKVIAPFPNGKDETKPPQGCNDAVIGAAGCHKPQPIMLTSNPDDTRGAAVDDAVTGAKGKVYDLMGNLAEWSSDLLPKIRAAELPWFCQAQLPTAITGGKPACPQGADCVYGNYQPAGELYGEYPVCIAWPSFHPTSGSEGSLFGGSFSDDKADREHIGTFARRKETMPNGDNLGQNYGFRCAGDPNSKDDVAPRSN